MVLNRSTVGIWGLFFAFALNAHAKSFSSEAWDKIAPIYRAIGEHPFNQDLKKGTLSKDKWAYYMAQDALYLVDYSRSLTILASKLDNESDAAKLMKLATESLEEEPPAPKVTVRAPATTLYASYLSAVAANQTREEVAAALLPCFWIYLRLADDLKAQVSESNPYFKWVAMYSSAKYRRSVQFMIELTDKLAAASSAPTKAKMFDAFALASRMEWYFFEGSYRMETWKP